MLPTGLIDVVLRYTLVQLELLLDEVAGFSDRLNFKHMDFN